MGVAEELSELWRDVASQPKKGEESAYYALLLRLTLASKKKIEESGRKYSTLPTLREYIRKRIVRAPAEHVKWLEISAFDLVANPLKKSLQTYAPSLEPADVPLVAWFVHAAKSDPSLALDVKQLEAWLATQNPPQSSTPPVASEEKNQKAEASKTPPGSEKKETEPAQETTAPNASQNSESKPSEAPASSDNPVAADRVFESS